MPIIGSSRAIPKKDFYDPAAEALALLTRATEVVDCPSVSYSIVDVSSEHDNVNQDSKIVTREESGDTDIADVPTEPVTRKSSRNKLHSGNGSNVLDPTTNRIATRRSSNDFSKDDTKSSPRKSTRISKSSPSDRSVTSKLSPVIVNHALLRPDTVVSAKLRSRISSTNKRYKSEISKSSSSESEASSEDIAHLPESDKSLFEVRYKELVEFKRENGHCLVPKKYPANPSLSYFVFRMRAFYSKKKKSGEKNYLTQERINRLNKIGFSWWTKSTDAQKKVEAQRREPKKDLKWDSYFEQFVQFQNKFGSSLIPKVYPENQTLSSWAHRQRISKRKLDRGEESDLTMEQKKRLDEIGFIWNAKSSDEWKAIELRRKREDAEKLWQKRFAQLVQFKAKKGHTRVPKVYPANSGLSSWVFRQRAAYKQMMNGEEVNGVTPERLKKLQDIGFEFGVRSEVKPSLDSLKTYLASNSKVEEATAEAIVGLWRSKYETSDDNAEETVKRKGDENNADHQQKRKVEGKRRGVESVITADEDQHVDNTKGRKKRRRKA